MNQKEYFILACKVFGIYCLVLSLHQITVSFPVFFLSGDYPDDMKRYLKVSQLHAWLSPAILLVIGIYLIKDGRILHKLAYPYIDDELNMDLRGVFKLFLKMLGVFLIVTRIPQFLEVISRYFAYTNAPKYLGTMENKEFVYIYGLESIVTILCGFYLLLRGDFFLKIGLQKELQEKGTEQETK
jgi:hypothetical protein